MLVGPGWQIITEGDSHDAIVPSQCCIRWSFGHGKRRIGAEADGGHAALVHGNPPGIYMTRGG